MFSIIFNSSSIALCRHPVTQSRFIEMHSLRLGPNIWNLNQACQTPISEVGAAISDSESVYPDSDIMILVA